MLDRLTGWAHRVPVKGANAGQARARPNKSIASSRRTLPSTGIISSEREFDRALQRHPELMKAMPTDRKKIIKGSKKVPNKMALGDGERLATMGSGAGVPGIKAKEHCPHLLHALRGAAVRKRCIIANGGEMICDSEIELKCEMDGHAINIKCFDLPVSCPILSVRRIVKKGNDIVFNDGGGYILHRQSKRRIVFVEREGVHFIKMKIMGAVSRGGNESGVARREPRRLVAYLSHVPYKTSKL